jgi:hypothetical protein
MELENVSKAESLSSSWASTNQFETVWRYLQSSEVYRCAAGLYALLYHWYSLDKQDLELFIKRAQIKSYLHLENSYKNTTPSPLNLAEGFLEKTGGYCEGCL